MHFTTTLLLLSQLGWIPMVYSHAAVNSPPIRSPGPDFLKACGQTSFDSVKGDPTGHIEEQEPVTAGCELTLCRGMLFSDQPTSNVQTVTPGQAMEMKIDCTIPHGGPANVTLIDTTGGGSGAFIGSFLKTFDNFCPTSGPTPSDQTNLQYNLPDAPTIGNKCQKAGDCVVQLFWATPDFSQNYYYCVDVVMAAAAVPSSSPVSSSSPSPSSSPALGSPSPSSSGFSTSVSPPPSSSTSGTATVSARGASQSSSAARRTARLLWF